MSFFKMGTSIKEKNLLQRERILSLNVLNSVMGAMPMPVLQYTHRWHMLEKYFQYLNSLWDNA